MRFILIIVAVICALMLANFLFWHVLGIVVLLLWLAFAAACCYGVFLLIRSTLFGKKQQSKPQKEKNAGSYKLWTIDQAPVPMFLDQPTPQQVLLLELNAHETLANANIVKIPIDTKVTILEDTGKECVKVRLQGSTFPKDVGWVARSSLFKETT